MRLFFAVAALAAASVPAIAHAEPRVSQLPLCYGDNHTVNTLLKPTGFQRLQCTDTTISGGACRWFILEGGTRPQRDYLVAPRTTTLPGFPAAAARAALVDDQYGTSPVDDAFSTSPSFAAPGAPPANLVWADGTRIAGLVSARCKPDWTAPLDESRGASLRASSVAADAGLVFALAGDEVIGDGSTGDVSAVANLGSCTGTLALQADSGSGWQDVATAAVTATPARVRYDLGASVAAGASVRLVLHATGTCSTNGVDLVVE